MDGWAAQISAFARAHGLSVGAGTIDSITAAATPVELVGNIVDAAPGRFVRSDYEPGSLHLLPGPFLLVGQQGELVLVHRAKGDHVWISGTGMAAMAPTRLSALERRIRPTDVITAVFEGTIAPGWRQYVSGFARSNAGRLRAGFWGTFLANFAALAMPIGALLVIDKVLGQGGITTLDTIIIALIGIEAVRYLFSTTRRALLDDIADDFERETTALMAFRLVSMPGGNRGVPLQRLQRLASYANRYKYFFSNHSVTLLADLMFLLALVALLFAMNATLAWVAVTGLLLAFVLAACLEQRNARIDRLRQEATTSDPAFSEKFQSLEQYRCMGLETHVWEQWARAASQRGAEASDGSARKFDVDAINSMTLNLLRAALLWFGALGVLRAELTLGQFIAFNLVVVLLLNPVRKLANSLSWYQRLSKAGDSIARILELPAEQDQGTLHAIPPAAPQVLELRDVSFSYPGQSTPLLEDVSLRIRPGEKIAIIGQSGVGKTTLLGILQGFLRPGEGEIMLGGRPLQDYSLRPYRRQFGVLTQTSALIPGTVLDNLTLGARDVSAEAAIAAADTAEILSVINSLPDGFRTIIGQDGHRLSAGQLQRLYLARALVLGRNYLLLDEPTSSLDRVTESAIAAKLTRDSEDRTIIAVTHSLEFAQRFERVFRLREGRLVALENRPSQGGESVDILKLQRPMMTPVKPAQTGGEA